MKLYILRHAIAEDRTANQSDRNRRLTARGVDELRAALRGIKRLKVQPDEILSSPYRRAWDTAVLAARALTPRRRPVEMEALQPGASLARLWLDLKRHARAQSVMLVGHEPQLSEFAAFLLKSPHLAIQLKKAGFMRLDLASPRAERPNAVLRWLLTPRQLARLG